MNIQLRHLTKIPKSRFARVKFFMVRRDLEHQECLRQLELAVSSGKASLHLGRAETAALAYAWVTGLLEDLLDNK